MSQKRSKKHHFVPKALQRRFCSESEQIWYAERTERGVFSAPELRNIASTFKKRDYYTIIENGSPSDRIERNFYGPLDNFLGKFLSEVEQVFSSGMVPIVNGDALYSIRLYIFHLLKRSPEFVGIKELDVGREIRESLTFQLLQESADEEFLDETLQPLSSDRGLFEAGRDVRVLAQAAPSPMVENALENFQCRWGVITGRHSFILPSISVYRIGNGGSNGIENPDMEMWLPVSPKRVLVLTRDTQNSIPMVVEIDRDKAREVNEFGVQKSNSVASHSEKLLLSLLASK